MCIPKSGAGCAVVLLAVALYGLLVPTLVLSQSVTARASSSGGDETRISDSDGGQSRSIYSHKALSPHRMMHFGKRPLVQAPPSILDLYRQPPMRSPRARPPMPYTLYFELPRDQVLEFVQPDPKMQLIEAVPDLLEYAKRSWTRQQQQQQQHQRVNQGRVAAAAAAAAAASNLRSNLTPTNTLKTDDDASDSFEISSNNIRADGGMMKKQSLLMDNGGDQQEHQQQQQQQAAGGQPEQQDASGTSNGQQDGDGINVASRSIATSVPFPMRADISSYLYGRRVADPQGSLLNLGNFIKKAEPQRNAMKFMHFGR